MGEAFLSHFLRLDFFFLSFISIFFFFLAGTGDKLEIYLSSESSVGSHHRGAERRVQGWASWWAFVAVPPPGQEITVFESPVFIARVQQRGQRQREKSQRPFCDGWVANFSCEAKAVHKFVSFKRRNLK